MNERGRACVNGENAGRPKRQRRRYRAVGKFGRRRTPRRPTGGRPDKQTYTNAYAIVFGGGGGMNGTRERDRPSVRANEKQSYIRIYAVSVSLARRRGTITFPFRMHSARAPDTPVRGFPRFVSSPTGGSRPPVFSSATPSPSLSSSSTHVMVYPTTAFINLSTRRVILFLPIFVRYIYIYI